jgi:hypothetical protein
VDGNLVERDMGMQSSWIGGRLYRWLGQFGEDNYLGFALPADCGYQCFPAKPSRVRKPDASFICRGRLPGEQLPEGHCPIAPDLAVEVVSPHDLYYEVDAKVADYLAAGVRLVWVVSPPTRTVTVYRPDGSGARLREADELTGEDVLPGFRCPVAVIFPPAPGPQPANGPPGTP